MRDSGNGRNGTISGGVSTTNGWLGQAVVFNGVNGSINFGNYPDLPEVTVSAVVMVDAALLSTTSGEFMIVDRWNNGENVRLGIAYGIFR